MNHHRVEIEFGPRDDGDYAHAQTIIDGADLSGMVDDASIIYTAGRRPYALLKLMPEWLVVRQVPRAETRVVESVIHCVGDDARGRAMSTGNGDELQEGEVVGRMWDGRSLRLMTDGTIRFSVPAEPTAEELIGLAGMDAANRQFEKALAEQVYKLFARVAALEERVRKEEEQVCPACGLIAALEERLREVEETLAELEAGR